MERLLILLTVGIFSAFIAIGLAIILWSDPDSPNFTGEFGLSGVTTYEPCLRAPGGCPCLRNGDCVQRLRDFDEHPVFWLGENFEGLPLTSVDFADYGEEHGRRRQGMSISYGSCVIQGGNEGCGIPLTIRMSRFCETAADPRQLLEEESRELRGAVAYYDGSWMLLRTSNAAIEFEGMGVSGAENIASNLVRANGGQPISPSEPFDPPIDECYAGSPTASGTP